MHFQMYDFSIIIQIRRKIYFGMFQILKNLSLQIFAHDTTVLLSRHVQNCVTIGYPGIESQYNEFTIKFELWAEIFSEMSPGAPFTNDFLPAIPIRWELRLAVIPLLVIRWQQTFAHVTTAQLLSHVQNFVTITVLKFRWEWNEIFIKFELRWKNC